MTDVIQQNKDLANHLVSDARDHLEQEIKEVHDIIRKNIDTLISKI